MQSGQPHGFNPNMKILLRDIAPVLTGLASGLAIAGGLAWLWDLEAAFYIACIGSVIVLARAVIDAWKAQHLVSMLTRKWNEPAEKTGDQ